MLKFSQFWTKFKKTMDSLLWWQVTLMVLGFLALLAVVGSLFFVLGDSPKNSFLSQKAPGVNSADFTLALSRLVHAPLEEGEGNIEILQNGDNFLTALLEAINGAQSSVNFSVFIWRDGEFSNAVLDALIAKQKQGVEVRLLLDGLAGLGAPEEKLDELRESGGKVAGYRKPVIGKLSRLHKRNHRRAIIIDGKIGFTGGMAIGDDWLGNAQDPEHWRDLMFKLKGNMAQSLQSAFADHWYGATGEILVGSKFYSNDVAPGPVKFIHLPSSPTDDDPALANFILFSVMAAQEKINIVTPYFIPDKHLLNSIIEKAKSGVDVRVLLPNENIDSLMARWNAQTFYEDLLEAGVKIYEYQPTFNHSKFIIVDGKWSLIGSPNINSRSRRLDEENIFGILDPKLATELEGIFMEDLGKTKEINLEEWRDRNPVIRTLQLWSRLFSEQY